MSTNLKVTFEVTESGTRSANVDLADAESWIAGDGLRRDEARALLAFAAVEEGIPSAFVDSVGTKWILEEESEDGTHYTYSAQ